MFLKIYAPIAVKTGHSVGDPGRPYPLPVSLIILHTYDPNTQACLAQPHLINSSLPRPTSPNKLKRVAQLHLNHKIIEMT